MATYGDPKKPYTVHEVREGLWEVRQGGRMVWEETSLDGCMYFLRSQRIRGTVTVHEGGAPRQVTV